MDTVEFYTLEEGMNWLIKHDNHSKPGNRVKDVQISRGPNLYRFEVEYG